LNALHASVAVPLTAAMPGASHYFDFDLLCLLTHGVLNVANDSTCAVLPSIASLLLWSPQPS
jgi:hypothetical protein